MALTARELIFYIRAENQASRVFKRVAADLRAIPSSRELQMRMGAATGTAAAIRGGRAAQTLNLIEQSQGRVSANRVKQLAQEKQSIANQLKSNALVRDYNNVQQKVRANATQLLQAEQAARDAEVAAVRARSVNPAQYATLANNAEVAKERVSTLRREEELLASSLDDVRLRTRQWGVESELAIRQANISRLNSISSALKDIGHSAQIAGIVGLGTSIFLAHRAAQFQSQVSLAATQARPAGAPVAATAQISLRLQKEVLKQMQMFPASSQEMADSLYQIFSSTNATIPQAISLLKTFNKAAIAGGASLKSMTEAGITIRNNFPHEFANMTQAMQVFFSAVRYGRMNADQFAGSLAYILPIAKSVHSSFRNVAADMAFITRQTGGRLTRQDAQGYARLIQLLGRSDVSQGLAAKGVAVFDKQTHAMRPLLAIIRDINKEFAGQGPQQILNFFKDVSAAGSGKSGTQGTIQALRVFAQLRNNTAAYGNVVRQVKGDQDEFTKSYQAMLKTPGVRWQILINQLRALAITLGTQMIPALTEVLKPLYKVFKAFNDLSPHTKKMVAEFIVFGSTVAFIGGTLLVLITPLIRLAGLLFYTRTAGLAAEGGFASLSVGLRLGLIGALILLIPLFIKYHVQIMRVVNSLGGLKHILIGLSIAMAAFKLSGLIKSLQTASFQAGMLRGRLGAIAKMGMITVGVTLLLKSRGDKGAKGLLERLFGGALVGGAAGGPLGAFIGGSTAVILPYANKAVTDQAAGGGSLPIWRNGKWVDPITGKALAPSAQRYWMRQFRQATGMSRPLRGENPWQYVVNRRAVTPASQAADMAAKVAHATALLQKSKTSTTSGGPAPFTDNDVLAAVRNIVKLDELAKRKPTLANFKAANAALAALQKKSNAAQFAAAQELISALESSDKTHTKKTVDEAKKRERERIKAMKAAQAEVTQAAQTLQQQYQSMAQANQSAFGQIFNGPSMQGARMQNELEWGHKITGHDLLTDIKSQLSQFRQWRRALAQLRKRNIPADLYQQILAAGPSALADIRALLSLNPKELSEYFQVFKASDRAVEKATKTDMRVALAQYRKYGKNIALAILQGLRSEQAPMLKWFENLVLKMFPGLAKKAHGKAREVTKGTLKTKPNPARPATPSHAHPRTKTNQKPSRSLQSETRSVTYNYHGHPVDYSTWLRKSKNHHRVFYKGPH